MSEQATDETAQQDEEHQEVDHQEEAPEEEEESEEASYDEEDVMEIAVEEFEEIKEERDELEEKVLRKTADLDNLRKRKRKDEKKLRKYSGEDVLGDLLEVIDNFDRALDSIEIENDDVHEGIDMIRKQLLELLSKHDVKPMEAEGEPFDPHQHEAMMQEERADLDQETVVEVFTEGYTFHDRVLRPASVKVGKPTSQQNQDKSDSEES